MVFTRSKAKSTLDADGNDNNNSHNQNTNHIKSEEINTNSHNQNTNHSKSEETKNNSHDQNTTHSKSEEAKNNNHSTSKEATNSKEANNPHKHNIAQSQPPLKLKKNEIPSYQFFDNEARNSSIDMAPGTLNTASSSSSYTCYIRNHVWWIGKNFYTNN